jgi:hypothetical protein
MARMTRTIISIPADEKRWLESYGKRHKISSAEVVRKAVREYRRGSEPCNAGSKQVREDRGVYGSPAPPGITDVGELRRRAIEAAGCVESAIPDLSVSHDRYIAEDPRTDGADDEKRGKR